MKKILRVLLFMTICWMALPVVAQRSIYAFKVKDAQGKTFKMKQLKGKTVLIVNTASECGLTPQYEGLEALYKKYKDKGLVVVAFPCNQFGGQEPGSDSTIVSFCRLSYDVSFPIMSKIEVNGAQTAPIYQYLKATSEVEKGKDIRWNFEKFLISPTGKILNRFHPRQTPQEIESDVVRALP